MQALLHFFLPVFATIEVEERIEVRPQAESGAPDPTRFRYEPFRNPKTGPFGHLNLRVCARINNFFSNLRRRKSSTPSPPVL